MGIPANLEGQRFGMLVVVHLSKAIRHDKCRHWVCICDCGTVINTPSSSSLLNGHTRSCGRCLISKTMTKHGHSRGGRRGVTIEYISWRNMLQRCTNPKNKSYKDYGGRGIEVSAEFLNFESFFNEVGLKPDPSYTLERINNSLGYVPGNIKWATRKEQSRNRSYHRFITYQGITMIQADWARELGISSSRLKFHIDKGRDIGWIKKYVEGQHPNKHFSASDDGEHVEKKS